MKPCVKYQKRIWLDAYGELATEEQRDVARHLAACPGCRHERSTLMDFIGKAAETHHIPALTPDESARLTGNIVRALEAKTARRTRRRAGFFGLTPGWAHMAAAACLIIAVIGGFWAWQGANAPVRTAAAPSLEEQVLVEDLEVIENLELLEEFEELEKLVRMTDSPTHGELFPERPRTMGREGVSGEMRRRHVA